MFLFGTEPQPLIASAERSSPIEFFNPTPTSRRRQPASFRGKPGPGEATKRWPRLLGAACGLLVLSAALAGADEDRPPRAAFTVDGTEERIVGEIEVDSLEIDVPHVGLSWEVRAGDEGENDNSDRAHGFHLQRADNPAFEDYRDLYEGSDRASFQPGLAEGEYFYRVRAIDEDGNPGDWSRPLHVVVEYQSMRLAVSLFAVGGVVFLATLALVVAGAVRDKREQEGNAP